MTEIDSNFIPTIEPLQQKYMDEAKAHLDSLTKPHGSLGRLEGLAQRLFAISAGRLPITVSPALMFTVAADHGVAVQGVSPYPQKVSRQMVHNFLNGGAGINVLCHTSGMDLCVVDAGCAGGPFEVHDMLLDRRLGDGTADISAGPAMSRETCIKGIACGVELAVDAAKRGYHCLGVGEMGIANSTTGAALYCALLGIEPEVAVGPGAGSDAAMVKHKTEIVHRALHVNAGRRQTGDVIDTVAAVGGFEIVVMCGIMLGAASQRLPVLIDGYICSAAYAAAVAISPNVREYGVLSHLSAEPGHGLAVEHLCVGGEGTYSPLLRLGLRLGEGTGGAVAYHLLRCAAAIYNDMATTQSAGVANKI